MAGQAVVAVEERYVDRGREGGSADRPGVYAVGLGSAGKHVASLPHGLAGQVADIEPPGAAPAHHERPDVVPLVDHDQRAAPGLLEQGVDAGPAVVQRPVDHDPAPGADGRGPAKRLADVGLVRAEAVLLACGRGGNLLAGRPAAVSAGATPTLLGRRGCSHVAGPCQSFPCGPPSPGGNTPGPSGSLHAHVS